MVPLPEDLIPSGDEGHNFNTQCFWEHSLYRNQMEKWLQYLKWYWMLNMDLDMGTDPLVLLARAIDPPVVLTGWKVNKTDPVLVKFALEGL